MSKLNKPNTLILGIGINDSGYQTQIFNGRKLVWVCPFYKKWKSMITRCYSPKVHKTHPSYKDCSVCDEWLAFSKFKYWVESFGYSEEKINYYNLDKDILIPGNKIYSPESCRLVHPKVNGFICGHLSSKRLPVGVHYEKRSGRYQVKCNNPINGENKRVGRYDSVEEAMLAYRKRKLEFTHLLIESGVVEFEEIAEALIKRYKD